MAVTENNEAFGFVADKGGYCAGLNKLGRIFEVCDVFERTL